MEDDLSATSKIKALLLRITRRVRAAERLAAVGRQFMLGLDWILRGAWLDNAVLGFSASAGLSADPHLGRLTRVRSIGPAIPTIEVFLHGPRGPP
ncbi:MAG: hypothetical protein IPK80_07990 [Nannocystis sp.]|nr:hypothetical protein [Nannocystis sp.]